VALQKDGTRVYGDIAAANYNQPQGSVSFECPANCAYLWLVVSGAPTSYWSRGWNGTADDDEQWPYKVRLYQTNVYGYANNNDYPTGIGEVSVGEESKTRVDDKVYNLNGQVVGRGMPDANTLPKGVYIYKNRKYIIK